jgi:putative colanic acid biosynthesis glycosyltransferase
MTSFSIVTVTRNDIEGLHRAAASIASQTYKDFEWIIIDGDSQDHTKDYLKAQRMTRKWLSEPDQGLYDAMNKGLDQAVNEYVVFMNSGDCFANPKTLAHISDTAEAKPDLIYGDAFEKDLYNKLHLKQARTITYKDALMTHHQAIYYSRRKIGSLRYDPTYKIAADYAFTQNFIAQINHSAYINAPLCVFELGGVSMQNNRQGRLETHKIRQIMRLVSPFRNILILYKQIIANLLHRNCPSLYRLLRRF